MSEKINEEREITILGNPGNPTGEAGVQMLERMNESHYGVTGWALDFLDIKNNDVVLDIGCGGGITLKRISEKNANGRFFGIDHSNVAVNQTLKLNAELAASRRLSISLGSVSKMPYEDNFFDKIITVESFYFWETPVECLKEVARVLKPNGLFALVADIYGKEGLNQQTLENIKMFNLLNPTPDEFRNMFEKAGFNSIQIKTKEKTDWITVLGSKA